MLVFAGIQEPPLHVPPVGVIAIIVLIAQNTLEQEQHFAGEGAVAGSCEADEGEGGCTGAQQVGGSH